MKKFMLLIVLIGFMPQLQAAAGSAKTLVVQNLTSYDYQVDYGLGANWYNFDKAQVNLPANGRIELPIADEPLQELSFLRTGATVSYPTKHNVDIKDLNKAFEQHNHLAVVIERDYLGISGYRIVPDPARYAADVLGGILENVAKFTKFMGGNNR